MCHVFTSWGFYYVHLDVYFFFLEILFSSYILFFLQKKYLKFLVHVFYNEYGYKLVPNYVLVSI
jgi:hypothetical protein